MSYWPREAKSTSLTWHASRRLPGKFLMTTNQGLMKTRRAVTQQDVFEAYNDSLEDLARTVALLYSQLVALQDEVSRLAQPAEGGSR